ncbi:MAG: class I SAM-dependent methyltransferase [Nanoarchaeota archaeon]|nr:class I SAM-dependent methyltransferase [Nanoarchaeota archaeon]
MKKSIQKAYRKWALTYDDEINPSIDLEQDKVMKLMTVKKNDLILDVGCGTGRYTKILADMGESVAGIDFSRNMLKQAKKKVKNAEFKQADITKRLPFPDGSFNKIVCSLVISHVKKLVPIFKEMKRVLKDDGFIVITTLHPDTDFEGYELTKFDFPLSKYDCSILHTFSDFELAFKKAKLKELKMIELKINSSVKRCFTTKSFNIVKGKPLGVIFKLIKADFN